MPLQVAHFRGQDRLKWLDADRAASVFCWLSRLGPELTFLLPGILKHAQTSAMLLPTKSGVPSSGGEAFAANLKVGEECIMKGPAGLSSLHVPAFLFYAWGRVW